jgi:predicted ribosome quality control (RQC) complex YloA/Tae2 family protein
MAQKDRFSSVDTLALFREIRATGHPRFEKATDLPGGRLLITIRIQGEGRKNLVVEPGKFAAFAGEVGEHTQTPGPFAADLRRLLSGAPMATLTQPGGERYLEIEFTRAGDETPRILVIELFSPGNVIAVKEGRIAAVASPRTWAHRTLKVGELYVRPPVRLNPLSLTAHEVEDALSRSRTSRVTTLAARLSLGGPIAEELLARAGIPADAPAPEEAKATSERVVSALNDMLKEIRDPPRGYLYSKVDGGEVVDVEPFPSKRWASDPTVTLTEYPTFSEAAYRFFPAVIVVPPSPKDEERARLMRLRTQQSKVIEQLDLEMREKREKADAILTYFVEVEEALAKALKEDPDADIFEMDLGDDHVSIDPRRSARENAQALYQEAKVQLSKLDGARNAIAETDATLAKIDAATAATQQKAESRSEFARPQRSRHFWFEKAPRWFVTSEGTVVVGGRDARTNDWVVKHYLKASDIYIHADVHGAPSVIVKTPANTAVGEVSLREAGEWAVCYSKAWRAGLASADAFWVHSDQVTKAGASGEFVPAGSWVIHGNKNLMRDLPTELAIGEVVYEKERMIVAAPPSAFQREGCKIVWYLYPGEEKERKAREKEMARELNVSLETIQSLLPGGGLTLSVSRRQ